MAKVIVDKGQWYVMDLDDAVQVMIVDDKDQSYHVDEDTTYFASPGAALDWIIKWAKDRGLVATMPSGLLRQVVEVNDQGEEVSGV